MDSIESKEGFLCNANAEQTLGHNEYLISLLIENELCERRRGCSAACMKQTYTENRYLQTLRKANYKRHPLVIGQPCVCRSMYKPAIGHSNGEDRDAAHEEAAPKEIEAKRNEFKDQFVLAPFCWNGHTKTGSSLIRADRMGEYNNVWEGADLHSDTVLPTNIQHLLAPTKPTILKKPTNQQMRSTRLTPRSTKLTLITKHQPTRPPPVWNRITRGQRTRLVSPLCRTRPVAGRKCMQTHCPGQLAPVQGLLRRLS